MHSTLDKRTITEDNKKRIVKRYCCESIHGYALAYEENISPAVLGELVHYYLQQVKEELKETKPIEKHSRK